MALNCAMLVDLSPIPLPDEMTITNITSGVELSITIPDSSAPGGGLRKMKESGAIYLTDQRLIFVSPSKSLSSVSIPLPSILSTTFSQPILGSNYLLFSIKPSNGGGLTEGTTAEVRFKDRAMFEFVSLLEKTRERAIYMKRQMREEEEGLPSYTSPGERSSSSRTIPVPSAVPDENPPGYDA